MRWDNEVFDVLADPETTMKAANEMEFSDSEEGEDDETGGGKRRRTRL